MFFGLIYHRQAAFDTGSRAADQTATSIVANTGCDSWEACAKVFDKILKNY